MNRLLQEDINHFVETFQLADRLQGACFLITGSTGLIGSTLVHCLLALNKGIKIIAPVRNKSKAQSRFADYDTSSLQIIECNLLTSDFSFAHAADYIIHCASPTASKFFVEHPIETFEAIYQPSVSLLKFATANPIKGFVYLSSIEVYGQISDSNQLVTESIQGYIDPLEARSSYPMAKRAVEHLCHTYAKTCKLPITIARLTQTTGVGTSTEDNRILVSFCRTAAEGKDIVLHTTGESARTYCYTIDAITGILYTLLCGEPGEAYNISRDDTYMSARELAMFIASCSPNDIHVRTELLTDSPYAAPTCLRLSSAKLQSLGWKPNYSMQDICSRLQALFVGFH